MRWRPDPRRWLAHLLSRALRASADLHYRRGVELQGAGRLRDARESYRKAIVLGAGHARAYCNLGAVLHTEGNLEAAVQNYDKALALSPDLVEALRNLGIVWFERGDMRRAETLWRRALQLDPASGELRTQLAGAEHNIAIECAAGDQVDEALVHYRRALELNPGLAEAALNSGALLELKGDHAAATAHYRAAIAARPELALAHFNLALQLLLAGDYENGWREYEWRWKLPEFAAQQPGFAQPRWDGSPLSGETVLLYAEQGFGDAIQFVRYATLVAQRGARVVVRCQPQLKALLRDAASVADAVSDEEPPPPFQFSCPLLSLPLVFQTTLATVPAHVPYIHASPEKVAAWRAKLNGPGVRKVGLVWASHSGNVALARRKTIPLGLLGAFAQIKDTVFYSLQKGPQAAEARHPPPGFSLVDLSAELRDFSDTAAVIENLDLVVTIDSAVAHLAGALVKPVWALAALPEDWRWAYRQDCAWYPTMRIFRQPRPQDWTSVVHEVAEALAGRR